MTRFRFRLQYIILFSLLLLYEFSFGTKVSAQILDEKGKPVENVTITDGKTGVFSAQDGTFRINTQAESLTFTRLGFKKLVVNLKDISDKVILEAEPVVLPIVRVIERYESALGSALDKTIISTDAEKTGSTIADILLTQSSFQTSESHLAGESQTLSLLGNLSRHTLIMLDNVPLNPHGETFDLSTLPLQNIKRIEIVKGNASLYGGASAIGGIVYLFTDNIKAAHPLKLEHSTSYGSYNQFRQAFAYEQQSPLLSYKVLFSRLSADNDFNYKPRPWWPETDELTRKNNRKQQQNVSLQMSAFPDKFRLQYKIDSDIIFRQLPGPVNFLDIYKNAYLTGQNMRHNLSLGYFPLAWSDNLLLWQNTDNTEYNNTRATNPVYASNYRQAQSSAGLKNQSEYSFYTIKTDLGLELSRQTYERKDLLIPLQSIDPCSRNLKAVSLKAQSRNELDLITNEFQAGMRVDDVSDFGSFTSWRIEEAVSYDGMLQINAGAAIGNSFSLPSFYDLYWKGDAQSLGNPDLEPETSTGGNLWLGLSFTDYAFKAAYYFSEVEKLIQWRQTYLYGTAWKPVNIGTARLRSWEFNADGRPLELITLKSSLTLTQALDTVLDKKLTYTPEARWVTNLILAYRNFTLDLNQEYTGRQWKTPDNLIDPIPAFTLYGAGLNYGIAYKKLQADISLKLNNLFDRQYEIYDYVPQPGFNWLGGIALRYGM